MTNITDSTCDWGLAQTEAGCTRTLASYDPSSYLHFQIVYIVVGSLSTLASSIMYMRSIKHDGSKLQQHNFLFCCYASISVIVRGIDPASYGHVIPRPIDGLFSDTCTAALYSVYILALGYWATVIQQGAALSDTPAHLKCLENTAIIVVWVFYALYDLSLFLSKGFEVHGLTYMELSVSAGILAAISTTFLVYGLRVLGRLQEYERVKKLEMPSVLSEHTVANHSFNMVLDDDGDEGVPVMAERTYRRGRPREGHASKIRKILLVAESVSLIVIAGQMYMAVTRTSTTPVELSCANGSLCSTVKSSLNVLHVLQVVCVWAVLWCFRKINKKEVIPRPAGY